MSVMYLISSQRTLPGSLNSGMFVHIRPPGAASFSRIVTSYPSGIRSFATVSEAAPAPMHAMRFPFFSSGMSGRKGRTSSLRSAATRFSRQIATGSPSSRTRRQTGSQGRSQVRPRIPGKTLDFRLRRYDSVYCPLAMSRMYSGTLVCAGHPHWQSTTRW